MTATSVENAELVRIPLRVLRDDLPEEAALLEALFRSGLSRRKEVQSARRDPGRSQLVDVALERGLVQATSLLVIDLDRCTRCDDCVRGCAESHGGTARFVREGDRYRNLLVPKSCFHCQDPVCLIGCPTGAIRRSGQGAVVEIDDDLCIGCQTCFRNCPYDAIVMLPHGSWGEDVLPKNKRGTERLLASKCDLCTSGGHDPAVSSTVPRAAPSASNP